LLSAFGFQAFSPTFAVLFGLEVYTGAVQRVEYYPLRDKFKGPGRLINGCSSIGRVAVSKTVGWEFESLHPCLGFRIDLKSKIFKELYRIKWLFSLSRIQPLQKAETMEKLKNYVVESWDEITSKVTWSKFSELQGSAILVLVASTIFALVIGGIDWMFKTGLTWLYTVNK
jgi:preprotein translocase subunit SecE